MTAIIAFMTVTMPVIVGVNVFGGFVAGIWLAINGDWWALGFGLLAVVVSHWIVALLLMPSFLLAAPGVMLLERGKWFLGRVLLAISTLYMSALMFFWCITVTDRFLVHSRHSSLLPILLWSYGVATGPWTFLASKDQQSGGGNEFSLIAVFFLQLGYLVGALLHVLHPDDVGWFVLPLAIAMLINWLTQQFVAGELIRQERTSSSF